MAVEWMEATEEVTSGPDPRSFPAGVSHAPCTLPLPGASAHEMTVSTPSNDTSGPRRYPADVYVGGPEVESWMPVGSRLTPAPLTRAAHIRSAPPLNQR